MSYLIQHKCTQYQVISTQSTNNWKRYLTFSLRYSYENSRRLRRDAVIGKVTSETSVTICQWTGRNISADKSSRNWQLEILHTYMYVGRRHTLLYVQPVVSRGTTKNGRPCSNNGVMIDNVSLNVPFLMVKLRGKFNPHTDCCFSHVSPVFTTNIHM